MKPASPSDVVSVSKSLAPVFVSGLFALVSSFLISGCTTTHEIKVDALAKPKAEEAVSYRIRNKNPEMAEDSLRYKEAAGLVRTALSGKGMYEAHSAEAAELVVDLDYGIGPPQRRTETVSEPVYRTVPGRIVTERVQVGTDAQGRPIYQTMTYQEPPTTEFDGYREYMVTTIVYEKYLKMAARENKPSAEGRPANEVWTIDVVSEGQSRDLRKNLPLLVGASVEYIGKDTHGEKVVRLKETNSDVAFVKKGM